MNLFDESPVQTGIWLYADELRLRVRIVCHPIRYGSGDEQDAPSEAEDQFEDTYYVLYQLPGSDDHWAGGPNASTLCEASQLAERALGPTLRWDSEPLLHSA